MRLRVSATIAVIATALLLCSALSALGAAMVLNEYNAVKDSGLLKNSGSDTYFGTVAGNGGDWMEFIVIQDYLDVRGWSFTTYQDSSTDATVVLPNDPALSALRSGTILTVSEKVATDYSYGPVYDPSNQNAGDWWINYKASFSSGDNTHKNFQVSIYDAHETPVLIFGPAGEGVAPADGIGNDEVFKLEATPTASMTPYSTDYKDGTSSTFGSPNIFSGGTMTQDLDPLRRCLVPEPSSMLALALGLGPIAFGLRKKRG